MSPSSPNKAAVQVQEEISAIATMSKVPEFWKHMPRQWFVQFEAIMGLQKAGEETRCQLLLTKIGGEELQQLNDIIENPPESGKYQMIKSRLLKCFEDSDRIQFEKLLSEAELGDRKPSNLLRTMRSLSRGKVNEDAIKMLWMRQLPSSVTAVLAVTDGLNLEQLSDKADEVYESYKMNNAATIAQVTFNNQNVLQPEHLSAARDEVMEEIREIKMVVFGWGAMMAVLVFLKTFMGARKLFNAVRDIQRAQQQNV